MLTDRWRETELNNLPVEKQAELLQKFLDESKFDYIPDQYNIADSILEYIDWCEDQFGQDDRVCECFDGWMDAVYQDLIEGSL